MIELAFLFTAVIAFALGHLSGQYSERKDWNRLIEDGIIPKPKNHKNGIL